MAELARAPSLRGLGGSRRALSPEGAAGALPRSASVRFSSDSTRTVEPEPDERGGASPFVGINSARASARDLAPGGGDGGGGALPPPPPRDLAASVRALALARPAPFVLVAAPGGGGGAGGGPPPLHRSPSLSQLRDRAPSLSPPPAGDATPAGASQRSLASAASPARSGASSRSLRTASGRTLDAAIRSASVADLPRLIAEAAGARARGARARTRFRVAALAVAAARRFAAAGAARGDAAGAPGGADGARRAAILAARAGRARDVAADAAPCVPAGAFARRAASAGAGAAAASAAAGGGGLGARARAGPSAVTPYLLVGDREDAADAALLLRLKVTHILNVATRLPPPAHAGSFVYRLLPIADTDAQSIRGILPRALAHIRDAHASGGRVLVHCVMGVSRSVTVAAAYLVWARGGALPLARALRLLQARRPCALPNAGFRAQLALWEMEQRGGRSSVADLDAADEPWDCAPWRNHPARAQALADAADARRPLAAAKAALAAARAWLAARLGAARARVAPGDELDSQLD